MITLQVLILLSSIYTANSDALATQNCASDDDDRCLIDCSSQNCENTVIDARDYNSLQLICAENNVMQSTCRLSKILCPQNGVCHLNCTADHICSGIQLISSGETADVYIECDAGSCSGITVNASSVHSLDITAIGAHGLTQSYIHAENADIFTLNCGEPNMHSKDACLHNDLYLASSPNNVTLNCFGESCRGSSIHMLDDMKHVQVNIVSNCECDNDIKECANYWYLFCGAHYDTNMGYVTLRDYECLNTQNITKCSCNVMQEYIWNNFEHDAHGVCGDDDEYNYSTTEDDDEDEDENINQMWFKMVDDMNDQRILIWIVMGSMVFVVILIMCYLCAVKMTKYNEIQLIRSFDPDEQDYNIWASAF